MVRSVTAILALLILPGFAQTQETAAAQRRTHEVVKGETLWDLAGRYLGNPFRWPLIADANRAEVTDPDLIFPGQVLVIPSLDQELARVGNVSVVTPEGAVTGGAPEAMQQGAVQAGAGQGQVSRLAAPPCPDPAHRTVFYQGSGGDRGCPLALPRADDRTAFYPAAGSEEEIPTASSTRFTTGVNPGGTKPVEWVPLGLRYAAEWLEPPGSPPESVGTLDGFAQTQADRTPADRATLFERVYLEPSPGVRFRVGDLIQSFQVDPEEEGLGTVCRPTGILTVTSVDNDRVVAMVSAEFDRVRTGDLLRMAPDYRPRPGVRPIAVESNVTARVLGFSEDRLIQGFQSRVFLGVGAPEGIVAGDEFRAFVNREGNLLGAEAARLQVLLVGEEVSTARVISLSEPVLQVGDQVLLVRKMQ